MKLTLCGSMSSRELMQATKSDLEQRGYQVDNPDFAEDSLHVALEQDVDKKRGFIDQHFAKIDTSDAILVVNGEKNGVANYIGGNTLMEMTYAYAHGLEVFVLGDVPDVSFRDEIRGLQPILLRGELDALDDYVASLPLLYMSTESLIKHTAVSRAMRRAGMPVRINGKKVDSGVSEQPMTIEETYEGAMNRHSNLKRLGVQASYYATIESGQHPAHVNHSLFGCDVVVIEKEGSNAKIGIDLDLEFPQEMLDKVPSQYPDLGVLVQQEYGAVSKDPFPYFTNGRVTRQKVLEDAAYKVAVQLPELA
ncbi:DUF84 family protein [Candidatus Mycosynbacter amalyticus]|uniref:inosine/xanthosine triphosphatase n=1 Tax=Candidatus Mycosynbacter amalyticus TaxID=2665156 RepID=A0A857MKP6_9BACT|nr:inosine/xanthosine triphosphatase [Candidatus Mycosynbacter amalyticus]QHN42335.1 DUF84 family protein [Candidatus Mycosynbacter amalyticus]